MTTIHTTRESWLNAAIEIFRPEFAEIGFPLPEKIRISVGWGATGARQENAKILGVTFAKCVSADEVNEVFVTPEDADTASMLETVLHELIHVALDCQDGHKGRFAEAATRLGFNGPMTATPPSVELAARLITIAASLGDYPGAAIVLPTRNPSVVPVGPGATGSPTGPRPVKWSSGPGVQGTRMIKVSCHKTSCDARGYTARTTRKWLDSFGAPICPGSTTNVIHRLKEG